MSFTLIAGPCVIESRDLVLQVAEQVKAITDRLGIRYVFKASFDKANRSSGKSFRGPGPEEGLAILQEVGQTFGLPVLTDIHESHQAVAGTSKVVHVKKGQGLDYRGIPQMQALGCPVIFDATHAVHQPGRQGTTSGGQWEFVAPLARAAVAVSTL
jgi:2-dehydro-3-deoxyphosphooctonate aldolase (KDO 8-P synthase)